MLKRIKLKGEQKKILFLPSTNPIQIKGVAGSGKTTIALYRAKHLLETQNNLFHESKIAIFTFNKTLTEYIRAISPYINGGYQQNNDEVVPRTADGLHVQIINFHKWAFHFCGLSANQILSGNNQERTLEKVIDQHSFKSSNVFSKSLEFFKEEFSWIKGKLLLKKEDYINAKRIGRGTAERITQKDKEIIWQVFLEYQRELENMDKVDFDDFAILALEIINNNSNFVPPFTHIIVDEAQDLSKAQILVISRLVSEETNSLSIIADAAQRIYKSGFNWEEVGINVRGGRTIELKKNYRNPINIIKAAISLLYNEEDTADFTKVETALKGEERPKVANLRNKFEQFNTLTDELKKLNDKSMNFSTVVLHRTNDGVYDIKDYLEDNGYSTELIRNNSSVNYSSDSIKICTMSSIKGLEFDNVFILGLDEDTIPFPPGFSENNDEYHISTERRLLYTCMTRAKHLLYLLSSGEPSRYLNEINSDLLEDITPKEQSDMFSDDLPF